MKATSIIDDEDEYENVDWPDISAADLDYDWEDTSTLDGAGTCDLDSTTSEFNFNVTDELDDASTDVDDSAFEAAEEECLRGAPVPSPQTTTYRQGKYVAWVVFRGHKQGVFQSWYVILYEFVLSYETVQAWSKRSAYWFQGKLC